jgi:hypothetical protein
MAVITLSVAMLFSIAAKAMSIPQYDKMATIDRRNYISLLVIGAKNALLAHGQPDQAKKVIQIFMDSSDKGGSFQFLTNLEMIRRLNAENVATPNNKLPPYQVEHAFYLTLKDNGVIVPISILLSINKDFKPSSPAK